MQAIATLGTLMGLAFTSGVRLYSTVLAVGLGVRFGFINLPESLSHLQVLATTPILVISGVVFTAEFIADKIPWFDTVWDAIHTFVRPLGAAILAASAIGDVDPAWKLGAFLLCGGIALSSHAAKSGTRLAANHSPEPFSNVGLSLGEDAFVVSGTWLAFAHPVLSLTAVVILLAIIAWTLPKLIRLFRRAWAGPG
jgi:hypothetical protein